LKSSGVHRLEFSYALGRNQFELALPVLLWTNDDLTQRNRPSFIHKLSENSAVRYALFEAIDVYTRDGPKQGVPSLSPK